jgi:hypothetical protein
MKSKLFLFIYLCLAAITNNLNGQDTTQSNSTNDTVKARTYSFAGIEIKGAYKNYVQALSKKGFTLITTDTTENFAALGGKISGVEVSVYIFWTPISKEVCRVGVIYPEHESWFSISTEYNKIMKIINTKYGEGICDENWTYPYEDNHEGYEWTALKTERLRKYCLWDGIRLSMNKEGNNILIYTNPRIEEVFKKEQQQIDEETY